MEHFRPVDGGARCLIRRRAPSLPLALDVARDMLDLCPVDHYPWRVEIQKDAKGARAFVTITFQRRGLVR